VAGLRWPLRPSTLSQRAQVTFWPEPAGPAAGEELSEPVEVTIGYTVDPGQRAAFLAAMAGLRRSRLRAGAFRWELYQDPADPSRYSEQVASTARAVEPARHLTRREVGADVPAGAASRSEDPGH
jgi:quinol monooxygenase YgiN